MKSGNKLDLIGYVLLSIPNILALIITVCYAVEAVDAIFTGITNPANYGVLVVGGTVLLSVFLAPVFVAAATHVLAWIIGLIQYFRHRIKLARIMGAVSSFAGVALYFILVVMVLFVLSSELSKILWLMGIAFVIGLYLLVLGVMFVVNMYKNNKRGAVS